MLTPVSTLNLAGLPAADPALDDGLALDDVSQAANRRAEVRGLLALGLFAVCQGRLTTETGIAVSPTGRTAQGTLYFTPFRGNLVGLFDGTRWQLHAFTQRALALTIADGQNHDVFLYESGGTPALELGAAWSGDATRSEPLALRDGVIVKSADPARRWLGTVRGSGANVTEDSPARRFLWNYYHRCFRELSRAVTGAHTYTTAAWRQWNADPAAQVEFVVGRAEDVVLATIGGTAYGGLGYLSLGFDSTTGVTPSVRSSASFNEGGQSRTYQPLTDGHHTIYACEFGASGFTSNGVTLSGGLWC